ncbi:MULTISPECIES: hypothetical protein [Bacillota]|nr:MULTISPECIES: hypothetical protein [Clostridia]
MMNFFLKQRITLFIFTILFLINITISSIKGIASEKVVFFHLGKDKAYILKTIANIRGDIESIVKSGYIPLGTESMQTVSKGRYEYPSLRVGVVATEEIIKKLKFTMLEGANNSKVKINKVQIESKKPFIIGGFNYYLFNLYLSVDDLQKGIYIFNKLKYTLNGKTEGKEILCYVEVTKESDNYDFLWVGGYQQQKFVANQSVEEIINNREKGYLGEEWDYVFENATDKNLKVIKIDVPSKIYPTVKIQMTDNIPSGGYLLKPKEKIEFKIFIPKNYPEVYHVLTLSPRILYQKENEKYLKIAYPDTSTGIDCYKAIDNPENLTKKVAK